MSGETAIWRPMFVLQVVLFPGEEVPLHIFEPRYRALLARCLNEPSPFGLLLLDSEGKAELGTFAEVLDVTKKFADGRADILVRGTERFRVAESRSHEDGYIEAKTVPLADVREEPDPERTELLWSVYREYARLRERTDPDAEMDLDRDETAVADTFRIAAKAPLSLEERATLLVSVAEGDREDQLLRVLARGVRDLERRLESDQRVRSNGHLPGGEVPGD